MARITDYPALTAPSDSDVLVIVDIAAGSTKKITRGALLSGTQLPASAVNAQAIAAGAVDATKLSTGAITLGYNQITSSFGTSSTTTTALTGLSASVTIPAGGRRVEVEVYLPSLASTTQSGQNLSIWDGTVGSGTQLQLTSHFQDTAGTSNFHLCKWSGTPSAGAKTYNVGISTSSGTLTVAASATAPAYIIVKAI